MRGNVCIVRGTACACGVVLHPKFLGGGIKDVASFFFTGFRRGAIQLANGFWGTVFGHWVSHTAYDGSVDAAGGLMSSSS